MKRYSTVLFDLYGTLVDIHTDEVSPALWRGMASFFAERGISYTPEELRTAYFSFCSEEEQLLMQKSGKENVEIDILNVFRRLIKAGKHTGKEAIPPEILAAREFRRLSTTHISLYAGAGELLQSLRNKGIKVILLSNAQEAFTWPELTMLGICDSFDDIFISSDYGIKKPDPDFFGLPLKKYGLEASDCLMVGNDLRCDIGGASLAGIDGFYILSALSPQEDRVRLLSSDPAESGLTNCHASITPKYYLKAMSIRKLAVLLDAVTG